ncbi:MOS1T transposase, partial [Pseudoatta argentina]
MSIFVPNKVYLRGILLHYFIQEKSAAEAHRILVQTYGQTMLCQIRQDKELEQLLDEDPSQTLSELGKILQVDESTVSKRLKGLGMIQKQGHWVPYELKPRTTASTAEKKRLDRFLDRLKRHVVFATRESCTARKMGESGL